MASKESVGICSLCGHSTSKSDMNMHLQTCVPIHSPKIGETRKIFHLRVEGFHLPRYWLNIEIESNETLASLDAFLRELWLEKEAHVVLYEIGDLRYLFTFDENYGDQDHERDLSSSIGEALSDREMEFRYTYVFDNRDTILRILVINEREGRPIRKITLLARNESSSIPCDICGKPSEYICTQCGLLMTIGKKNATPNLCSEHINSHTCAEEILGDQMILTRINSPRLGIRRKG